MKEGSASVPRLERTHREGAEGERVRPAAREEGRPHSGKDEKGEHRGRFILPGSPEIIDKVPQNRLCNRKRRRVRHFRHFSGANGYICGEECIPAPVA